MPSLTADYFGTKSLERTTATSFTAWGIARRGRTFMIDFIKTQTGPSPTRCTSRRVPGGRNHSAAIAKPAEARGCIAKEKRRRSLLVEPRGRNSLDWLAGYVSRNIAIRPTTQDEMASTSYPNWKSFQAAVPSHADEV